MKHTPSTSPARSHADKTAPVTRRTRLGLLSAGAGLGALAITGMTALTDAPQWAMATAREDANAQVAASLGGVQALPKSVINDRGLLSFADVVESVSPSVVSVLVERSVEVPRGRPQVPPGFERFFGFPDAPQEDNDDRFG
ncbi:MAG: hypothetical protein AAFQ29_13310 [Pseudomonadota bacterium]